MKLEANKRYVSRGGVVAYVAGINEHIAVGWWEPCPYESAAWNLDGSYGYCESECDNDDLIAEYREPERRKVWMYRDRVGVVVFPKQPPAKDCDCEVIGSAWVVEGQWAEQGDKP